jgi:Tetratricopeptide repeat
MGLYDLAVRNLVKYGKAKEAGPVLEQLLRIREQSLAEDHPDRLASQHNLAVFYWESGSHETALDTMARVVEIHKQVLEEDQPSRQSSEA